MTPDRLSIRDYATNIRDVMSRADTAAMADGTEWYSVANATASRMAADHSVSVDTAARILAVLSPRQRWAANVAAAESILRAYSGGATECPYVAGIFGANTAKAWRIANGDPSALSGPKVTRFYANIVGDDTEVTLDVWAMRAAGCEHIAPRNTAEYSAIADAYRTVASEYGLSASALQAVAWIVVRGSAS